MIVYCAAWARLLRRLRVGKLMYVGGSDVLPPPLAAEEEADALLRLEAGDPAAKRLLIEHNLRLVVFLSKRFESTGINLEDMISIGTILMHVRKTANQKGEISLDEPINTDWDGNELLLSDVLGTDGDVVLRNLEERVDHELLREALARLSARDREIISLRFGLDGRRPLTQKEVADGLGISQSYISRLEKRILERLRQDITRQLSA